MVCKLKNTLYRFKQAGRNWDRELKRYIIGQDFPSSKQDNCLFIRKKAQHKQFLCGTDTSFGETFVDLLKGKYKIIDFSYLNLFWA